MIIADRLRTTNRAEYILYMWQVEDIVRAYHCDIDELKRHYLKDFQASDEKMQAIVSWYADICRMMQEEGLREKGHLQINRNALADLEELHNELLKSDKFPYYKEMYYKVLPYIVELRSKQPTATTDTELTTCFNALYGALLLRLQSKQISPETQKALQDISTLLGQLSDYYLSNKKEPLDL